MVNIKKLAQYSAALAVLGFLALGLSRVNTVNAQTSSTAPSGTHACLINANYSGYNTRSGAIAGAQSINALLMFNFNPATPTKASLSGIVVNEVSNFDGANPTTATTDATPSVEFTVTTSTASPYIYKLTSSTPGDVPYYIAVTNSGNSLLFMSSPANDKTHNGACQKV